MSSDELSLSCGVMYHRDPPVDLTSQAIASLNLTTVA